MWGCTPVSKDEDHIHHRVPVHPKEESPVRPGHLCIMISSPHYGEVEMLFTCPPVSSLHLETTLAAGWGTRACTPSVEKLRQEDHKQGDLALRSKQNNLTLVRNVQGFTSFFVKILFNLCITADIWAEHNLLN